MASAYVIWDRNSKTFVGGAQPLVYTQSADAQAQANANTDKGNHHDKQPKAIYDIVTVTV